MRLLWVCLCAVVLAFGCAGGGDNNTSTNNNTNGEGCVDDDGDGFDGRTPSCPDGPDCNDSAPSTNPSAQELCGDRRDNDCNGEPDDGCNGAGDDCVDNDGDNYGEGPDCFGADCDDTNADINPRAEDIPNNGIDEDCQDGDRTVSADCIDMDGDGYGAEGSMGCEVPEVDCDDEDPEVHPMVTETCDGIDNDCVDGIDNCPLEGTVCTDTTGGPCQGGAGAQCENHDDCAGTNLRCDPSVDPKVCKSAEDGPCNDVNDCFDGLTCDNNVCTGNFCLVNQCNAPLDHCDQVNAACVECPYFDGNAAGDAACTDQLVNTCAIGGWCAEPIPILTMDVVGMSTEDLWLVNAVLAICWIEKEPVGDKDMCFVFEIGNNISRTITEDLVRDAFVDGDLDNEFNGAAVEALDEIWGVGLFNLKDIDWNKDLAPGTEREVCLWYEPGGFFSEETMVLDDCINYAP